MPETRIRCGDHVHHGPSGEDWVVAFADYENGDLSPCGWPEGVARIADCTLIKSATDDQHAEMVDAVVKAGGMRGSSAARLYKQAASPPATPPVAASVDVSAPISVGMNAEGRIVLEYEDTPQNREMARRAAVAIGEQRA